MKKNILGKKLVTMLYEDLWNKKDLTLMDKIFLPDTIFNVPGETFQGLETASNFIKNFMLGFPDIHHVIDDLICEDHIVAVRWHGWGTHQGEFAGIPATGKKMNYSGTNFMYILNDKIGKVWLHCDANLIVQQLTAS